MENTDTLILQEIKNQIKVRLLNESVSKLKECLKLLSEDEVWQRPNENSNSMGNLVLHLCGNIRQWFLSGLGNTVDHRKRQLEFDERGPIPKAELIAKVDEVMNEVEVVANLITVEDLTRVRKVQDYEESGLSIIIHVIEHFSYHVGQMAYFVKAIKDMDLQFYRGRNLDIKGP